MKEPVTEKIQVLLSKNDLKLLYKQITEEAVLNGEKPSTISSYIRSLIKKHIDENILEK